MNAKLDDAKFFNATLTPASLDAGRAHPLSWRAGVPPALASSLPLPILELMGQSRFAGAAWARASTTPLVSSRRLANLANANAPKASFNGADLTTADLRGASFDGASFKGARLPPGPLPPGPHLSRSAVSSPLATRFHDALAPPAPLIVSPCRRGRVAASEVAEGGHRGEEGGKREVTPRCARSGAVLFEADLTGASFKVRYTHSLPHPQSDAGVHARPCPLSRLPPTALVLTLLCGSPHRRTPT